MFNKQCSIAFALTFPAGLPRSAVGAGGTGL